MGTTAPLQGLAEEHLQLLTPPRTLTKEYNTGVVYPAAQGRGYANELPELASEVLEREKGFEPSTLALARRCSTTELFPLEKYEGECRILLAKCGTVKQRYLFL